MAKKEVRFTAHKTVNQPTTVHFHTKDGKMVSFKAVETVKVPTTVRFTAKDKKK